MKLFRKTLFWLHLISGVLAGIFIFTMCVTGVLLSFESNILEFAESDMRYVAAPPENVQKLSANEVLTKIQTAKPNAKPTLISVANKENAAINISFGREGQAYVNPFTGEITGEGAKNWRGFFRVVEDLHRWLAIPGDGRQVGKALNDAANFLFLFLAISGVYIWFPRRLSLKHFKAAITPRWKVTGRARDFNWHTVIGFWSSLVLIILTLTAVVMSYSWANNLVYTLTGNDVPQQQQRPPSAPNDPKKQEPPVVLPANTDALFERAENFVTDVKSVSLSLPLKNNEANFNLSEGRYWNSFARSTLTLNAETGETIKFEDYGDQNSGRQLRSWVRFTHTGETGGFVGQLIGFLACVGGAVLVYTGFALAWRRLVNWLQNRKKLRDIKP